MKVHEYAQAFSDGEEVSVEGLCGRILRGVCETDFTTLTNDPTRRIVMLMGPDGLEMLPGKSGYDMLTTIGYTEHHIAQKLDEGMRFRLAVFPESTIARPATWQNMLTLAGIVYPDIKAPLLSQADALQTTSFSSIQDEAGYDFATVDVAGMSDERYMTYERYVASSMGLVATRAFMYYSLHLRELYSGDGYTYTPSGDRGLQEYAIPNERLDMLGEHVLLDVPVTLA